MQLCNVALDSSQQGPIELRLSSTHVQLFKAASQLLSRHLARPLLHVVRNIVLECV